MPPDPRWPPRCSDGDRAGRLSCATGLTAVSSRSAPRLRRHGHAPSPEDLSPLQSSVRYLSVLRSRPCLLLSRVSRSGASAIARGGPPATPTEPGRTARSSRPPAGVSRPREGSDFPAHRRARPARRALLRHIRVWPASAFGHTRRHRTTHGSPLPLLRRAAGLSSSPADGPEQLRPATAGASSSAPTHTRQPGPTHPAPLAKR